MQFLFPVPASSIVTQSFAEHVHRAKVNNWTNYNGGIDWAVPSGSPIAAAQDGTVSIVRNDATGYGTHVRIQHAEGYLTIYGHLMDFNVRVGDKVKAGQVIGRSDNTGNSTGPHLHFELRKNNVAVDPAPLLTTFLPAGGEPGGGMPGGGQPGGGMPGGEQPGPGGEMPGGEIPIGEEPQSFPLMPRARVISNIGLNVRMGPGVSHPIVGWLPPETQVEVLRKADAESVVGSGGAANDLWLQIGHQQFIAQRVAGEVYAVWAPLPPPAAPKPRRRRKKSG
jgi:hypothetical protein